MEDIIIIGGGPAGTTAATLLAKKGHKVRLFEKEKFPREHVGESLLPYCYGVFDELGVLEEMKARFVRKPGVRFVDTDGESYTTWCFGHVIKDPSYLSFHVLRDEFDNLLLNNARQNGVQVHEETRVKTVDLNAEDSGVTVTVVGPDKEETVFDARFLIDASGRDTFMAQRLSAKEPRKNLDRTALSTHWVDAKYIDGIEEGLLQIVYLGGEKKGWIWVIPVGTNRLSIGVVMNHAYIREQKSLLENAGVDNWQEALYLQEVHESQFVSSLLEDAHRIQPIVFNGNFSYVVHEKFGENFALVGDASSFIDPIFASGVYLGIKSAQMVANAVAHRLAPGMAAERTHHLLAAYKDINGAYGLVEKAILNFYNPKTINWANVGSASQLIHREHENALALAHYLLAGNFFEKHEEYSSFLDLLEDPRLLEFYSQNVIERPEFQTKTCGSSRSEVFNQMLQEHEKRRSKTMET